MLTWDQIQVSIDINLLNTATDCLRFVTEFFEIISQSGPHIYHSALLLAPQSSVVRKLYGQQISSPSVRVVTSIPTSWDSCTATAGVVTGVQHAAWSLCGQFIAVGLDHRVEVRDANTLERVSTLMFGQNSSQIETRSLAFSHDGCLLACTLTTYSQLVVFLHICIYTHLLTGVSIHTGLLFGKSRQVSSLRKLTFKLLERLYSLGTKGQSL